MNFCAEYFVAVLSIRPMFLFVWLFGFACEFASNGKSARDAQITNTSINWCALCISCDLPKPKLSKIPTADRNGSVRVRMAVIVSSQHGDAVVCTAHQLLYIRFNFQIKQHALQNVYELTQFTLRFRIHFFCAVASPLRLQLLPNHRHSRGSINNKYIHCSNSTSEKSKRFSRRWENDFPLHSHNVRRRRRRPCFRPVYKCILYVFGVR